MPSIYQVLDSLGIKYKRFDHVAVFTCDESSKISVDSPGAHTKNLFLRTEKSERYYLLTTECKKRIDLKKLASHLGPERLTFGKPDKLQELLGLTPGSVSPLGLVNDTSHQVTLLVDSSLKDYPSLLVHPNDNTATLELSWPDFNKFLSHTGHSCLIIQA